MRSLCIHIWVNENKLYLPLYEYPAITRMKVHRQTDIAVDKGMDNVIDILLSATVFEYFHEY